MQMTFTYWEDAKAKLTAAMNADIAGEYEARDCILRRLRDFLKLTKKPPTV